MTEAVLIGASALVIIAIGIGYRYATRGGDVSVEADEGGLDIDASSDDSHFVDLSADGEADVAGALGSGTSEDDNPLEDLYVQDDLTVIDGVGEARAAALRAAGYGYVEAVAEAGVNELTAIEGIGSKRAANIQQAAQDALDE